ncbi:hypothetical protein [Magnetospirillum molischianum]|uniref:Holin of 3TMs, for gene-transfer release n=1 Tax=Magnetospirillum molischianum DSM 120 TaxID=1150626 RepID=H8FXT3_MAGML|nr:hypothetical protein [Magnetospirillum molischianum]CCG43171.1 hypothetical protein PHAMO_580077 [Magnetospirillum molischianum DSM 120]
MGIPIIDNLLGIGKVVADRLIPDRNKAADQEHERAIKQIDVTAEGERARNYFTPRAIVMYAMAFAVIYGVVLRPFVVAFGVPLPEVDISAPMRLLLGLLGLEFTG